MTSWTEQSLYIQYIKERIKVRTAGPPKTRGHYPLLHMLLLLIRYWQNILFHADATDAQVAYNWVEIPLHICAKLK